MRVETVRAWMFVGFCLLTAGTLLYMSQVAGKLAIFLATIGLVYFIIGLLLSLVHDKHMAGRTRAGRE